MGIFIALINSSFLLLPGVLCLLVDVSEHVGSIFWFDQGYGTVKMFETSTSKRNAPGNG
jgi:hypothetical protein